MALKRKRSSPGFSSPASDATSVSSTDSNISLPFFYAQSKPIEPLHHKPTWSFPTYDDSSEQYRSAADMNSRTRKRHRDDRPEEEDVYSNTISLLFAAQKQQPHAEPAPSQSTLSHRPAEHPQRSTLHAFWRIPKSVPLPTPDTAMVLDPPAQSTTDTCMRCEDCDELLRSDSGMELDEETVARETACIACKRSVCDRCAVLGNARICLGCAGGHER